MRLHALTAAAACFFATATTGCVSHHSDNAVIESHFTRLEQTCFGYEPTVWRTMAGQCESAVRQIPEPVIRTPKAADTAPTPATEPAAESQGSALDSLPQPGQEQGVPGLFRDVMPPVNPNDGATPPADATPGTEPAPATEPTDETMPSTEPAPETEPAKEAAPVEPPATEPEPAEATPDAAPTEPAPAEPTTPPPAEPPAPQFSFSSARTVSTNSPDAGQAFEAGQASVGSAKELFRTLESALGDAPQPTRKAKPAPKKGPTGLAKFISY